MQRLYTCTYNGHTLYYTQEPQPHGHILTIVMPSVNASQVSINYQPEYIGSKMKLALHYTNESFKAIIDSIEFSPDESDYSENKELLHEEMINVTLRYIQKKLDFCLDWNPDFLTEDFEKEADIEKKH